MKVPEATQEQSAKIIASRPKACELHQLLRECVAVIQDPPDTRSYAASVLTASLVTEIFRLKTEVMEK